MARVNRTTGIFLILGVAALLGTVAGARLLAPDEKPAPADRPEKTNVFCMGNADSPSGLLTPSPNIAGKVLSINVSDGATVKKGQELIHLDDQTARDQLKIEKQELEVVKAKLANAKEQTSFDIKIIEQQNLVDRAHSNYQTNLTFYGEAKKNADKNIQAGSKVALENATIALDQAKREQEAAEAILAKLKSADRSIQFKEYEQELKAQTMRVEAAEAALERYIIRAPADGTIVEINYQIGGPCPLPPGDAYANRALVVLPNDPLVIRAEVGQDSALLVKVGQRATVTYRASGQEFKWEGKVTKVAAYLQKSRAQTLDPDQFVNARTRECVIAIDKDPKNSELVHGARVSVEIHTSE